MGIGNDKIKLDRIIDKRKSNNAALMGYINAHKCAPGPASWGVI